MKLAVSFLSLGDDKEKIEKLNSVNTDYIHYDVIDGKFTEGISLNYEQMKDLKISKPKDVHLMVEDVKKYIDDYKNLNPEYITFHAEANVNHKELIDYIHSLGIKAGISINPNTPISRIKSFLKYIDLVLIMSVYPGKGGQKFIDVSSKINELKTLEGNFLIEVDGGINNETIKSCMNADIIVVGSYITNGNYEERIDSLWENI